MYEVSFLTLAAFLCFAAVLWRDPGSVAAVDFSSPSRAAELPTPPFRFEREITDGTSAKVLVRDSRGVQWQVKGGPEARAEAFVTRLVSALGYFAEATAFVAHGTIQGVPVQLERAAGFIQPDGRFTWASFEKREPDARFASGHSWHWNQNPFSGSPELAGLRILVMLVSNWDNKDAGWTKPGSNTGVLEWNGERIYFVTDWGQSLGSWKRLFGGSNWNCHEYRRQSRDFVKAVRDGEVRFGYAGQQTAGFRDGITVENVRWLMQYLGQVTDAQIRIGLMQAGATPEEQSCFAAAIRERIEILRRIAESGRDIR